MSKKKFTGSISGKGYYIALILCAAAIGISGYLYYRNANLPAQDQEPTAAVDNLDGQENDHVEAVATQPGEQSGQEQQPLAPKPQKVEKPVAGETVTDYAMDCLTYNQTTRDWRVHDGVDIAAQAGAEVVAAADGTVYTVYEDEMMGMTVVIRHEEGYTTKYASLAQEVPVAAGDQVSAGQTVGYVGNTALLENAIGDHVHFSVSCDGKLVDPLEFLE